MASPARSSDRLDEPVKNGTIDVRGKVPNRRSTGSWPGCIPMLAIEVANTVIFLGIVSNLITYLTRVLHQGVAESARDVNNWQGTLYVSSVLGAFLSDAYLGRYKTMSLASLLYVLGLSCLTISATIESLRPAPCETAAQAETASCPQPSPAQSGFFFFSLYAVAFAAGSMRACLMSFGADQFDDTDEYERQQKSSFFNWLIWCVHAGGFIGVTGLVYVEEHVGWGWGFGILIIVVLVVMSIFFVQASRYRYRVPEGSPFTKVVQVLVAAFKNRAIPADADNLHEEPAAKGKRLVPHTRQFLFLDKAAALQANSDEAIPGPWKLSTVTRVEEVKMVIRMLPIWVATLWFITAPSQSSTFFLRQGLAMDNHLGSFRVPQASMFVFSNLGVLLFVPFYDYVLVPTMRKATGIERGISLLQRIGVGIAISVVSLVVAALVEIKRKRSSEQLSIFWLVPQYFILGIAEAMENTGLIEFFHDQSPDTMQSLGVSFALANIGVGSFLSSLLVTAVNKAAPSWLQNNVDRGHLDSFYWLIAGLSVVNLLIYVPLAYWYSYKAPDEYAENESSISPRTLNEEP